MSFNEDYRNILIIDDEQLVLDVTSRYLKSRGYSVSTALTGKEGLDIIRKDEIHLVLIDLYLPDMSGFKVIEKGLKINSDLIFIVISGLGEKEDVIEALRLGARDYFVKPLTDWDSIDTVLSGALDEVQLKVDQRSCQENLASAIFKAVDSGIVVVDYKSEMIVDVNPSACIMFGVEYDDLVGAHCSGFLCDAENEICPVKQMKSLEEQTEYLSRSNVSFTRNDGSVVHLIKSAITLVWRGRKQIVCNLVDITEDLKLTDELKRQRNMAQLYMDVAQDIFIALDLNGNLELINKKGCETLKVKEEDAIGKNWFDTFVPSYELYKIKKEFNKLLTSHEISECESWIMDTEGGNHLIRWKNAPVFDNDGNVTSTFSSGEDITDIRRAEQELEKYWRKIESELENNIIQLKSRSVAG